MNNDKKAILRYAGTAPTSGQIDKIRNFLEKKFDRHDLEIDVVPDDSVGGGFILSYANYEYDWSDVGRARQLRNELNSVKIKKTDLDTGGIISMFKQKVDNFDLSIKRREVGRVSWVGDGIANIDEDIENGARQWGGHLVSGSGGVGLLHTAGGGSHLRSSGGHGTRHRLALLFHFLVDGDDILGAVDRQFHLLTFDLVDINIIVVAVYL